MLTLKERCVEPIPGYRLVEPLGRGGFGEVWKCLAPGGLYKAIKFVAGDSKSDIGMDRAPAAEELEAIQRVKSVRHPFLLSMERVEVIDGELIIVMELADRSMLDLLRERQAAGHKGIDQAELLAFLGEAANVLDHMNFQHGLQHLDIKPGNLFLIANHVKVADFGLVQNLTEREGGGTVSLGAITPLYAAPELFRNTLSQSCDQYSLAIVYQELLTGTLPFHGKNSRQLMLQHSTEAPDLAPLPEADRAVISRALAKDPAQRFGSCKDLIQALQVGNARGFVGGVPTKSGVRPSMSATAVATPQAKIETKTDIPTAGIPARPAHGKYLPEYVFHTCLGRTPSSENWEAKTTDGRRWLVRFLFGVVGHNVRREQEALARLQGLQHPTLPAIQLLSAGPGCLIAVTEMIDTTLRDRFQEARSRGLPGVPRPQLLDWLWHLADALDGLAEKHALCHLGLTPRSVMFKGQRVLLNDFGLASLLWQPAGQLQAQIQARYAAPEVLEMRGVHASDQYSLAILFQEMLTGEHPLRGRRPGDPNLLPLPLEDRSVLARALHLNPEHRFPSCAALLEALDRSESGMDSQPGSPPVGHTLASQVMAELMEEASEPATLLEPETWLNCPGGDLVLRSRFAASLPVINTVQAFEPFRKHWNGQIIRSGKDSLTLALGMPTQFWKRLFSRPPGLLLEIQWLRARPPAVPLPEITVHIRGADKSVRSHLSLLRQIGPVLLESLRTHLVAHPDRRLQKRMLWTGAVEASFVLPDGQVTDTIMAHGKDISLTGMGLYMPCVVPGSNIHLNVSRLSRPSPVLISGKCVRVQRCADDLYEAGILID